MKKYIDSFVHRVFIWLKSKHAGLGLGLISFAESLFLPVITDPFLVAVVLANRSRWFYYTTIAIGSSILGGLTAYVLGYWFFDSLGQNLLDFYNLSSRFNEMAAGVDDSGFIFVLLGALTPIPYKLVALASGFLKINLVTFILASIFGRILRLGTIGFAAHLLGPKALELIRRYLHALAYVLMAVLTVYILYSWIF